MDLASRIRVIPDFPKPGISFKDITTLLKDGAAFKSAIHQLRDACRHLEFDLVVSPEARGFIIGSALAYEFGSGFVPVRKAGKLPAQTLKGEYQLEYGKDMLEIHLDSIVCGQRVLIVDDLLATGGTIKATMSMLEKLGAEISAAVFLIELAGLPGRKTLRGYEVISLIKMDD